MGERIVFGVVLDLGLLKYRDKENVTVRGFGIEDGISYFDDEATGVSLSETSRAFPFLE
jgi:hypothetical protein